VRSRSAAAPAAPIDAPIRLTATTVELPVGNVAAPVETVGQTIVIRHFGPGGRAVQATIDAVTLAVEASFDAIDAIAAIGGSRRRPVTGCILRQDRPAEQAEIRNSQARTLRPALR
jgi:hypothetical protein